MNDYSHIVFATDLGDGSLPACRRAAALRACFGARLTLLYVVERFPQDRSNEKIAPENIDPREFRERDARQRLQALAVGAGCADAAMQVSFTSDSAWHGIARFVADADGDLLVLAGREDSGAQTLAPSTSQHLSAQQPCDILTVYAVPERG